MVDVDLNYARPNRDQNNRRRRGGGRDISPEDNSYNPFSGGSDAVDGPVAPPDLSAESFPTLGGSGPVFSSANNGAIAKRVAISSGHSSSNWSEGHRRPTAEDFPSLPGAGAAPSPVSSYKSVQKKKTVANSKPRNPAEDFPELGGPSNRIPGGFRPAGSAPIYRNIEGANNTNQSL